MKTKQTIRWRMFARSVARTAATSALVFVLTACAAQSANTRARPTEPPTPTPDAWQRAQMAGQADGTAVAVTPAAGAAADAVPAPDATAGPNAIADAIEAKDASLAQALTLVPDNAELVTFTDWMLVKQSADAGDVTSQSASAQQADLIKWLKAQTPFAAYGFTQVDTHANDWGWNSLDVVWEVATRVGENPVYVLKLRDDLDVANIYRHFEDRQFKRFNYLGATVFAFSGNADWASTTQRSIYTTAVLEDQKVLIMSYQPQNVRAILELNAKLTKSLGESEDIKTTSAVLADKPSVFMAKASFACKSLDTWAKDLGITGDAIERFKGSFSAEPVHAYSVFGVGYAHEGDAVIGTLVMHYDKAEDAQADQTARENDLKQGMSLNSMQPYTSLLTLDTVTVQGNDLVLQVRPANNSPKTLWSMITRQDMAYARCPQAIAPRPSSQG